MVARLEIPALVDAHVHLRQNNDIYDRMSSRIAYYSSRCCSTIIAMPNVKPPIHDLDTIEYYKSEYERAVGNKTRVHLTMKWLPRTTSKDIINAKKAGVVGLKLYIAGSTTNADDGVPWNDLENHRQQIVDVLGEAENQNLPLLCHGETPGFCMDREDNFLPWFADIATKYKKLHLTLEHITTENGITYIRALSDRGCKVLGTITLHHMMRTLDNVIGHGLNPDEYCMPIPKYPNDRDALLNMAIRGEKCFALGSDSAPHNLEKKYCRGGCAGVFSAPVLVESLVELFQGKMDKFEDFCVNNANDFYGFEKSNRKLVLKKVDWIVPKLCGGIVPFRMGETIKWTLLE